ncbi:hypothetical protein D9757_005320 [Collybiopsis confluens]|uniref:Retrotransposon gag domain-containing protein n=1 Tax=Collybiopsis confluens TaxID=2823264 RepID=A0A8H5M949_9AGAR|nr:hypothetical protein D9757_005320 [Collybiopsis confluens]
MRTFRSIVESHPMSKPAPHKKERPTLTGSVRGDILFLSSLLHRKQAIGQPAGPKERTSEGCNDADNDDNDNETPEIERSLLAYVCNILILGGQDSPLVHDVHAVCGRIESQVIECLVFSKNTPVLTSTSSIPALEEPQHGTLKQIDDVENAERGRLLLDHWGDKEKSEYWKESYTLEEHLRDVFQALSHVAVTEEYEEAAWEFMYLIHRRAFRKISARIQEVYSRYRSSSPFDQLAQVVIAETFPLISTPYKSNVKLQKGDLQILNRFQFPGFNGNLELGDLPPGEYTLCVKSQNIGKWLKGFGKLLHFLQTVYPLPADVKKLPGGSKWDPPEPRKVVPAESVTITSSYSAHVSDSEDPEYDCTNLAHAWDTVDKTYVHRRVADTPSAWFDCHNQPCPNATESHSIQTERRTGRTRRLLIPLSQIETFEQNPPTPSLPITAPPPRFGRTSNPTSSRASPALIAPFPRRPVDTDVVISAVGQALIPTRAESIPEPIRVDTPPNSPIQPDPEMAQISGQDVLRALNNLATNQAALQRVVTDVVTSMNNNKGVSKPHNYNGIGSEDARRFLAAFEVWAQGIPNLRALTGNKPVKSAISFLEGDAAIWATPIAENISAHTSNNNVPLTYPDWADFRAAFTARFETADPVTDAKNMLKALYQGKNSVAAYAATFKQYSERTGYSDTDLR